MNSVEELKFIVKVMVFVSQNHYDVSVLYRPAVFTCHIKMKRKPLNFYSTVEFLFVKIVE